MPNAVYTDQEWLDLFQQCRTSGKSNYQWCYENHIPTSSFYRHLKKAIDTNMTAGIRPAETEPCSPCPQEVVELGFSLQEQQISPKPQLITKVPAAMRIRMNSIQIEITNQADADLIRNTISALQRLC